MNPVVDTQKKSTKCVYYIGYVQNSSILQNTKKGMKRIITMDSKRIQIPKQTSGSLNIVVILLFQEKEKKNNKTRIEKKIHWDFMFVRTE